jgi:hypothetical protein
VLLVGRRLVVALRGRGRRGVGGDALGEIIVVLVRVQPLAGIGVGIARTVVRRGAETPVLDEARLAGDHDLAVVRVQRERDNCVAVRVDGRTHAACPNRPCPNRPCPVQGE